MSFTLNRDVLKAWKVSTCNKGFNFSEKKANQVARSTQAYQITIAQDSWDNFLSKEDVESDFFFPVVVGRSNRRFLFSVPDSTCNIFALNTLKINCSCTWIIDLGASNPMTNFSMLFSTYSMCFGKLKINTTDGSFSL